MITIKVPAGELYNSETKEFIYVKETTLQLEHSLIALSKWESKWCKPFLTKESKTTEETLDYIRCMTTTSNIDPNVFLCLTDSNIKQIIEYIEAPMTATTFSNNSQTKPNREIITSELIYYWMIAYQIPFECQKWHLTRLLTLIRICGIKNSPAKKMSRNEILNRNRALNEARKKANHSTG